MSLFAAPEITYKQLLTGGVPGLRVPYVGVGALAGGISVALKDFFVGDSGASVPFTLLYTCDGTTGPTDVNDHADRLDDASKYSTQTNTDASAKSWWMIESAQITPLWQSSNAYEKGDYCISDGWAWICMTAGVSSSGSGPLAAGNGSDGSAMWFPLFAATGKIRLWFGYQGSGAQKNRIIVDYTGTMTINGTDSRYTPSATAQSYAQAISTGSYSGDRVLHALASDDGTALRWFIARGGNVDADSPIALNAFSLASFDRVHATFSTAGALVCATPLQRVAILSCGNFTGEPSSQSQVYFGNGTMILGACVWTPKLGAAIWNPRVLAATKAQDLDVGDLAASVHDTHGGYVPISYYAYSRATAKYGTFGRLIDLYYCVPGGYASGQTFGPDWAQADGILWPNPSGQPLVMT